jgi:CubicO group peptidase (beta-lactamase class C family)
MQRHIDAGDISGAVTLVASRGRLAHVEAHGVMDFGSKKPMTKDALFRIFSMTKVPTAVAVMMMEEEGKLHLTDPVSKFIPVFKELKVQTAHPQHTPQAVSAVYDGPTVAANREVTIADLLTHSSGMVAPSTPKAGDTLAALMPRYAAQPLHFQPGTDWEYSGTPGADVLARIVEIVSGQQYDRFLRIRLFEPLGMKDTSHSVTEDQRPRVVTLYARSPKGIVPVDYPVPDSNQTYFSGSAGLVSTAEDYLQFAQMLCNGGELNGRRFLKADTVRRMASNYVDNKFNGKLLPFFPNHGFGFGYLVAVMQDRKAAGWALPDGSFGWFGAFGSQVWINPKEQLVTILMIQTLEDSVQRDFETAVIAARGN